MDCSFAYKTLLVKGNVSSKEGNEAKTVAEGVNYLNDSIKYLEKKDVILLVAQKSVTRNLWVFVCDGIWKSSLSISDQRVCIRI
jgi:hypothetical protein